MRASEKSMANDLEMCVELSHGRDSDELEQITEVLGTGFGSRRFPFAPID